MKKIIKFLDKFSFNKSTKGYYYILECLNLCIEEDKKLIINMGNLYEKVSNIDKKHRAMSICWNISKAVQSMNKLTNENVMKRYFPYNLTPSPKIFLNEILQIYYSNI